MTGRFSVAAFCLVLVLSFPGIAQAKWLRAESPKFIIYSDGSESELRQYATKLEVFDQMLRMVHGLPMNGAAPRKLEIYLVFGVNGMRRVSPGSGMSKAGFYSAGVGAIFAVARRDLHEDFILLHEYTHHFMLQNFPYPYPGWLIEGYAEYFDTTTFTASYVEVGSYGQRAVGLTGQPWLPFDQLLSKNTSEIPPGFGNVYYGEAWTLTHYFLADAERSRQLDAYVKAVGAGADPVKAMETVTGRTAHALERTMLSYLNGGIRYTRYRRETFKDPQVTISEMEPSAGAVLLEALQARHQLYDGVDDGDSDDAKEPERARQRRESHQAALLKTFREAAGKFPGDRLAQLALARAQVSFGDRAAGEALLREWLATRPDDVEALQLLARSRMAAGDADTAQAVACYREAGGYLAKAYKIDPQDYRTLFAYARSRSRDANYPNDNTLEALLAAHELAPQVSDITLEAARGMMRRGRDGYAASLVKPLANDPHASGDAKAARTMLAEIAARTAPVTATSAAAKEP